MADKRMAAVPSPLGVRESGVPLAWRSPARLWAPGSRLEVVDGAIVWVTGKKVPDGGLVAPDFRLLDEFVRLADPIASDGQIVAFARAWGQLDLCPHGLPRTHDPNSIPHSLNLGFSLGGDWRCRSRVGDSEQLDWWRYWARQAAALRSLIADVRLEKLGSQDDWEVTWTAGPWATGDAWEHAKRAVADSLEYLRSNTSSSLALQRELIARALQSWLRLGGVQVEISWTFSERPSVEVRNKGLFDTIGLLLVFLAGQLEGFALCRGCGTQISPGRRLGPHDRARWCAVCRDEGRPRREASRAYHRRKAADSAFRAAEADRKRRSRAPNRGS
jgi:hypothetical protein